jgi:23S rRNA pseudouridine1911/1915/1917 synthase
VEHENQADFRILGETPDFLAVDKPGGLLVHPTKPGGPWTLWDGLKDLLGYELANGGQVSIINRLDRETSGVVLVAKSSAAARQAGLAMQGGQFSKVYWALVFGWPDWEEKMVDAPILRRGEVEDSPVWLERMAHPEGQAAVTRFQVIQRLRRPDGAEFSWLSAHPVTGRTHQIRVHAALSGYPVIGDKLYAKGSGHYLNFIERGWTEGLARELWLPRHALHCHGMAFAPHEWRSEMPADLAGFLMECGPLAPR